MLYHGSKPFLGSTANGSPKLLATRIPKHDACFHGGSSAKQSANEKSTYSNAPECLKSAFRLIFAEKQDCKCAIPLLEKAIAGLSKQEKRDMAILADAYIALAYSHYKLSEGLCLLAQDCRLEISPSAQIPASPFDFAAVSENMLRKYNDAYAIANELQERLMSFNKGKKKLAEEASIQLNVARVLCTDALDMLSDSPGAGKQRARLQIMQSLVYYALGDLAQGMDERKDYFKKAHDACLDLKNLYMFQNKSKLWIYQIGAGIVLPEASKEFGIKAKA